MKAVLKYYPKPERESPRVRECAPLAGPANAGEKSGKQEKWGMSKIRLIYVQNVQNCRSNEVLLFVFEGLY